MQQPALPVVQEPSGAEPTGTSWREFPPSTRRVREGDASVPPWCSTVGAPGATGSLTAEERELLVSYYTGSIEGFEWGAGSSSLLAQSCGVQRITTVDTVAGAIACVLSTGLSSLGQAYTGLHVQVHGDQGSFGNPVDEGARAAWPDVSSAIFLHPAPHQVDVALVDGRFRAASIFKAASVLRENAVILVHDWDREAYHAGEREGVLRLLQQRGRLAALQRTEKGGALTQEAWAALWSAVEFSPS